MWVIIILTKNDASVFSYLRLLRSWGFFLQTEVGVCVKILVDTNYVLGFVVCNLGLSWERK